MKTDFLRLSAVLFTATFVVGCGSSNTSPTVSSQTTSQSLIAPDASQYFLSDAPSEATGVLQFKGESKDGQVVHVHGLIGGGLKPWVDGRAVFVLVDEDLDIACAEADCPSCRAELTAASTMVKFVDDQGQPLKVDARKLLGVKDMQSVVVRGLAKRDEAGNTSIVADGIFLRR
jgi:hypothetical protein